MPGHVTRKEALAVLIRYAAERVAPAAANGTQVVTRADREAVREAVERLFPEAHGRSMASSDYHAHQIDDRRDDTDETPASSELILARTGFERVAQIGQFTLYEVTHSEGGGSGVTLHAEVITWKREFHNRWFAELAVHNTLPQDRSTFSNSAEPEYIHPWDTRLELAGKLMDRVKRHARHRSNEGPVSGVYSEGESEEQALERLQSLLERVRLGIFHYRTGNNGRL